MEGQPSSDPATPTAWREDPIRLVLVGLMGSGKSTVARALASRRGWLALDLDVEVERAAGKSIEQIFAEQGEEGFRRWESSTLSRLLQSGGSWVLACGGGAVLKEENRKAMRTAGPVIWLDAPGEELARRICRDRLTARPLLNGPQCPAGEASVTGGTAGHEDLAAVLARMRQDRREAYTAVADLVVQTAGLSVEEVVVRLDALLGRGAGTSRYRLTIPPGGGRSCAVRIEEGGLEGFGEAFAAVFPAARFTVVVSDRTVARLHGGELRQSLVRRGVAVELVELEPDEGSKSIQTVALLWERLAAAAVDRGTPLVALGGGVVGDVAGFAAATWLRGIPWVYVPTTLLAQVDSSVGGKTGINHHSGKNLIGAFHQPRLVFASMATLRTLPDRQLRAGLAEAVKTAVIGDPELFDLIERRSADILKADGAALVEVVRRSLAVKAAIVAEDEREEQGVRRRLNFGHTLGHALEAASHRPGGQPLLHGEAVALGMVAAARIAELLGLLDRRPAERLVGLLRQLSLPTRLDERVRPGEERQLVPWLVKDKKNLDGKVAMQVFEDIGKMAEAWLSPHEIVELLARIPGGAR
ncbi:MAG: 3-dehydroquinate synthase [Deltaproteobacteria bacterium]|nr:3-dehydroquinate synthase [Deltaproteobacteria bacterium]